jgi:hypothetical protein
MSIIMVPTKEEYKAAIEELHALQQEERLVNEMIAEASAALEGFADDPDYC